MARRGLGPEQVVAEAMRIADAEGLEAVTIARVAAALGVRPPSLYNHVASREALLQAVGARILEEVAAAMGAAAAGRSGEPAVLAIAEAHRACALRHPGAYATTGRIAGVEDERFLAAGAAVVDVLLAVLRGYGLAGDEAIHAARALRATVHGFASLELSGGFALPQDLDASFTWTVRALAAGLAARSQGATATS